MDKGHFDLLSTDVPDFLMHDVFNFFYASTGKVWFREDPCGQRTDETGPQEPLMTGRFCLGRHFP
jgi:hypothetical protein